jgi:hypothetical protein
MAPANQMAIIGSEFPEPSPSGGDWTKIKIAESMR